MRLGVKVAMLVAVLSAFGTQVWADQKLKPEDRANIHVVGVLVELGDQAEIKHVAMTVFGNKTSQLPIADWGLNDLAMAEIQKALAEKYIVKPVPFDAVTMATIRDQIREGKHINVPRLLRALPASDIDAYLVLLPEDWSLPYPSNQLVYGLGVYHQSRLSLPGLSQTTESVIHVNYLCMIESAKTMKSIGFEIGATADDDKPLLMQLLGSNEPVFPHSYLEGVIGWPIQADALSDEQKTIIKNELSALIIKSVDYTLGKVGLIDPLPAQSNKSGGAVSSEP